MAPYEGYLLEIAQAITVRDEDRQLYTADFEIIRNHILNGMCKVDNVFNIIYRGTSLFGSYSNNVRIKYPSEFDVIFKLSVPFSKYINVEEDEDRPGYVNLDFEDVMEEMYECNGYTDAYNRFVDLVDTNNNYLRRSNLQRWLKDVMETCLDTFGNQVRGKWGHLYTLIYSKRGLAHTIYAKCSKHSISIDFVPGICFGPTEWMQLPHSRKFKHKCDQWFAVPKPTSGPKGTRRYAFMVCNPKVEHDLLLGRQNLKVVFRLLKSLRNAYGMYRLKSYFLTTAFLWEIQIQSDRFWHNPLHILLEHMLETLASDFADGSLPYFWNKDLNLLDILSDDDIDELAYKLGRAHETLRQYKFEPNLSKKRCLTHFELP
uniref:Uncharacterized protein n=1 Tax=Ceratitis capitata TaxID=7213 RepID=W8C5K8_CERCA